MSSNLSVSALRDVGCVRTNNEDNFGYDPVSDLYVVCDGMGGMAAGEVASSIACGTAIHIYATQSTETPPAARLLKAIHVANDVVREIAHNNSEHHGMGTTLVAAALQGNKLLVGNVGDSRAYLLQNGGCMQLTVDHSYINELVRQGTVKVEDIHHPNLKSFESVITRAIGAAPEVEPDFFSVDLQENDTILLASDGLTRYVDSNRIAALVDPADLAASCQRLIQAAKDAGGADNITSLLLRYNAAPQPGVAASDEPVQSSPDIVPLDAHAPPAPDSHPLDALEIAVPYMTNPDIATPEIAAPESAASFDELLDASPESLKPEEE